MFTNNHALKGLISAVERILSVSCAPIIWIITILELLLLVYMIVRFIKTKSVLTLILACVTLGLLFDALVICIGAYLDVGALKSLSQIRFVSHGVLISLIIVFCSLSLKTKKPYGYIIYGLTLVFMIAGAAEGCATVLDVRKIAGVTRMASVEGLTPAWASAVFSLLNVGIVVVLIACGIAVWIKEKTPLLFAAGMSMLVFSALGPATGNGDYIFFISMIGEILMIVFMLVFTLVKERKTQET